MENTFRTTLNDVPIEIDLSRGSLLFFGIPAAMFWLDPSLYRMLAPLVQEVGPELARLLMAHESSKGTKEDYEFMVQRLGPTFEGLHGLGPCRRSRRLGPFRAADLRPPGRQGAGSRAQRLGAASAGTVGVSLGMPVPQGERSSASLATRSGGLVGQRERDRGSEPIVDSPSIPRMRRSPARSSDCVIRPERSDRASCSS